MPSAIASTRRSRCSGRRCGRWWSASAYPVRCRRSSVGGRCAGFSGITGPRRWVRPGSSGWCPRPARTRQPRWPRSLFARGADFTASMVFMFASTNLVVELGIVLWLLLGWQFALAEFVGGAIMIFLLAVLLPLVIPPPRRRGRAHSARHRPAADSAPRGPQRRRLGRRGAAAAAGRANPQPGRLVRRRRLHHQRPDHAAQGAAHRLRRRRLRHRAGAHQRVAVAVPDRSRILVVAGERGAGPVAGDLGVRLLDRQRAVGSGAVGREASASAG